MTFKHYLPLFILAAIGLNGCALSDNSALASKSFAELVNASDWTILPKDFEISCQDQDRTFALRVQGQRYLSFSLAAPGDGAKPSSGPLDKTNAPVLTKLFDRAVAFTGQEKTGEWTLSVRWDQYAESLVKWAVIWQGSKLRKQWRSNNRADYQSLTAMIREFVMKDFQDFLSAMGLEAVAADMEKMNWSQVQDYKLDQSLLSQAKIQADLTLPVPLMLYIKTKVKEEGEGMERNPAAGMKTHVDYIFATAEQQETTLYLSFHRSLDEYEITGSKKQADGSFANLLPMRDPAYQAIGTRLLKAAISVTEAQNRKRLYLRLGLSSYPKLEAEVLRRFNLSPLVTQKTAQPRAQLPGKTFFDYDPLPASGFVESVTPFLKNLGFHCQGLLIHTDVRKRAADHPLYGYAILPTELKPDDPLTVPSIVYMVVDKK